MFTVTGIAHQIKYTVMKFSGGEVQVRLLDSVNNSELNIFGNITSSDEILELMLLVDALRRLAEYPLQINLNLPYLPYARQDRVCAPGEALSLRVMCDLINSLNFASVTVWDVHSDVALALLNNVRCTPATIFIPRIQAFMPIFSNNNCVLVAPDAGAAKKTWAAAKYLGLSMVQAEKVRSTDDGSITGTVVHSAHIGSKCFLILDDICDGGRTFIELARVLRPLTNGNIYLYVTHGIFSKGLDVFDGLIDHIFTSNPFPNVDKTNSLLTNVGPE
jgi:ribose-phosphate pyrophosphokinase